MTVVVRKDSRSSESAMNLGHFLLEDPSQVGDLFQLAYGPGVPHQEWSPSSQDIQEISPMDSGRDWEITHYLADTDVGGLAFDPWPFWEGNRGRKPLVTSDAPQNNALEILRKFFRSRGSDSFGSTFEWLPYSDFRWFLRFAESEEAIVTVMRLHGLTAIVDRLNRLRALIADDPDEPNLVLESLRSFADFFMQQDRLPVPEIGAGPEGYLEAEWRIPAKREAPMITLFERWVRPDERYWGQGDGILAMKFLPSGSIQYAAVSGPVGRGKERLRSSGIHSKNSIMPAIQAFTSRLVLP